MAADSIYGVGEIELALRRAYKGYVLGVTGQHRFWSWDADLDVSGTAEEIAKGFPDQDWLRLSAGAGTKGPRLFDWAYLPLATLPAEALDAALDQSLWTRGLLVRRSLSDGALAYFTTWCPAGTPVERLVAVEGRRWAIEDAFETAKTELGLAHNESRSWHGWHRHVSLVMLAFACWRGCAGWPAHAPKNSTTSIALCPGPSRRSGAWRCGWRSGALSQPSCWLGQPGDAPTKSAAKHQRDSRALVGGGFGSLGLGSVRTTTSVAAGAVNMGSSSVGAAAKGLAGVRGDSAAAVGALGRGVAAVAESSGVGSAFER